MLAKCAIAQGPRRGDYGGGVWRPFGRIQQQAPQCPREHLTKQSKLSRDDDSLHVGGSRVDEPAERVHQL